MEEDLTTHKDILEKYNSIFYNPILFGGVFKSTQVVEKIATAKTGRRIEIGGKISGLATPQQLHFYHSDNSRIGVIYVYDSLGTRYLWFDNYPDDQSNNARITALLGNNSCVLTGLSSLFIQKGSNNFGFQGINGATPIFDYSVDNLAISGAYHAWKNINSYAFTKIGGFGSFDKGVELQDGKVVSDVEAIAQMKPHKNLKTPFGVDRIDPKTIPQAVIRKKDPKGKEKKEEDWGEDLGAMMSILIGAIKEIDNRLKKLEK